MNDKRRGNRRMLVLLALLFMAPLGFSFWLYYGTGWRPMGTTNNGELITPARLLPEVSAGGASATAAVFHEKWSLVVVAEGDCDASCQHGLEYAEQTLASLGRLQARTQPVLVHGSECCSVDLAAAGHPQLRKVDGAANPALLRAFPTTDRARMIFVVDPIGNLMMRYDSALDPKGLRADLKHLLDLSQIG
jgi:hypothetical protein